jgi:hypothetical protein
MKRLFLGLSMLLFAVCIASQNSWSLSCPSKPASCNYDAKGRQDYKVKEHKHHKRVSLPGGGHKNVTTPSTFSCDKTGSNHCPSLIKKFKNLHHQVTTSCLSKIVSKRVDGCSVPKGVKTMYKEVFKAACNEHDICYHSDASKSTCDADLYGNMNQICDSYYTGLPNRVQEEKCKAASEVFYEAVKKGGQGGFNGDQAWKNKWCKKKLKQNTMHLD